MRSTRVEINIQERFALPPPLFFKTSEMITQVLKNVFIMHVFTQPPIQTRTSYTHPATHTYTHKACR
ncbi:hypothetical protein E2C01_046772 [Portunus trituberculatus]|uniref:Uncharacterized protein n=1 Tax=Portunus trituberculatus TaxID=210409 RepID=A0A5B7G1U6_PORTR|nr:hypothetical protein [Portunus trituberculatus]